MPDHSKIIQVQPGSELDRLLTDADERPVELEKAEVRYQLNRVDELPMPEGAAAVPSTTPAPEDEEYTLEAALGSVTPATDTSTLDKLITEAKAERAERTVRALENA